MSFVPTFDVEGVSIPKALIGINSLLGWSHTSRGRDEWIKKAFYRTTHRRSFCSLYGYGASRRAWSCISKTA